MMRIDIATTAAELGPESVECSFFERRKSYGADKRRSAVQPAASKPLTVVSRANLLRFVVNIDAFKNLTVDDARRTAGATCVKQAAQTTCKRLFWLLDGEVEPEWFRQLVTGAMLGSYKFSLYKSGGSARQPQLRVTIVAGGHATEFRRELKRLQAIEQGVQTARELANVPPNDLPPLELAERAKALCQSAGLKYSALNAKQLQERNYAGLNAVGQGSSNPPVLFTIKYEPAGVAPGAQPLCLVGKGLTFDSGGLSIKPWEGMWDMKGDMAGAAAVIGALQAIALLKLPVPVVGVVAAAENMPDGRAYRPGDILRFRNGKTVEIHSTDAEGRLVLADALLHAQQEEQQRRIVEFSTLTGACVRALGHQYIGLMSRAPKLTAQVKQAAQAAGEPVWELPLHPEYRSLLDSPCADMRNIGGPLAGAQTAAAFLHEFVTPQVEYVHLDIAGTFLADKEHKYWTQVGATGSGVRLAVELAEMCAG